MLAWHLDRHTRGSAGVPHLYYDLLVTLAESPQERKRMAGLARDMRMTPPRLTRAVERLEKKGWVRRENLPSGKRKVFAILTDEGQATVDEAAPGHARAVREAVLDRLTPQQAESFAEIMQIIAEGLEPE
ncbi:MarR family winged helix-turn-helix transcriptional regulator [Streptomyces sp. NBC_00178]|uniref:MarR family winged helix-turn-helix transcriptional regulator n=1 Tax=Streptomyces sp. NBC_00178 TaxID=2975672 RepID=UPI002E2A284C|nr:MarR family transcriptional regulator [Streptomyces sp. NBC_00178]